MIGCQWSWPGGVSGLARGRPPTRQGTTQTQCTLAGGRSDRLVARGTVTVADVVESRDGQRSSSGLNLDR
jgi:hypothetical protein